MNGTGIIILAAGNSSRLGKPKQLLTYGDKSLIEHIKDEALKASLYPVVIVTGAYAEEVLVALHDDNLTIVYNKHWQTGMASGIVAGLLRLLLMKDSIENVILSVCDQPLLSARVFRHLINEQTKTGKRIVACTYADTLGTPVLFGHHYFEALLLLRGREGAKKLLTLYATDVATVSFPQGIIDIDTEEDYENLLNQKQ